jgi:hypothetical protein
VGGFRRARENIVPASASASKRECPSITAVDRALTLALLKSANGCLESKARAKAMLDAHERAAVERDRQAGLAALGVLRASLLANP